MARPRIGVERFGWQARAQVLNGTLLPERQQERYAQVSSALLEKVAGAFALAEGYAQIRLHGDCHLGNLLWNEQGPVFVDLDDCAMGPRVQDMWMVISGSPDEQQHQWGELLEGYRQFADFDYAQVRLIEPLRALRMLHHAAWVTHRWDDPAFPRAFPWFGEERYWEGYLRDLMEQIEQIEDPPLLRGVKVKNAERRTCAPVPRRVIVRLCGPCNLRLEACPKAMWNITRNAAAGLVLATLLCACGSSEHGAQSHGAPPTTTARCSVRRRPSHSAW